jgi:hypothetical protein
MAKEYGYVKDNGDPNPSAFLRDIIDNYYRIERNLSPYVNGDKYVMAEAEWMEWRDNGTIPETAHRYEPRKPDE